MVKKKASPGDGISAEIRQCPQCGKAFIPGRSDQRYCSANCRKNASRDRKTGKPAPAAKEAKSVKRRRKRKKSPAELAREDFEEMVDPIGDYESLLRLSVRRLKRAVESEETPERDLPALSRQLLAAAKELEQFDESDPLIAGENVDEEIADDEFTQATV